MSISSTADRDGESHQHKKLMDKMYRVQRHFYDATRAYYLLGRNHMIRQLDPPSDGHVLEMGCGTGRNILRAASMFPRSHFYGVDISDEMLRSATQKVFYHNRTSQIRLAQADAVTFDGNHVFGRRVFDRIYFSYTLSMIPEWQTALQNAAAMLSPQGEIHIVDFGQCENLPNFARQLLRQWLRMFHVEPRAGLQNLEVPGLTLSSFNPLFKGYAWYMILRPKTPLS